MLQSIFIIPFDTSVFNEMKGDVGMSLHEKEGNKKNYTKQITHPYIFVSRNGVLYLELVVKGRTYYKIIICC